MSNSDMNDFDVVQGIYDGLSTVAFFGDIHRSQVILLPEVANVDSALVVGGGTGRFLLELLAQTAVKRVVYIEKSEKMLRKSQHLLETKHPEWRDRVDFRLGTEELLTPADGRFALIVTPFLLSCFDQANSTSMFLRLAPWLASDGRWLFTDFEMPKRGFWLRLNAGVVFKIMFKFFNVFSNLEAKAPPRYDEGFAAAGLKVLIDRRVHFDMIRAALLARA
jgi:ubiquinone/menaquinone biosynthesis C-methylase UbiE